MADSAMQRLNAIRRDAAESSIQRLNAVPGARTPAVLTGSYSFTTKFTWRIAPIVYVVAPLQQFNHGPL